MIKPKFKIGQSCFLRTCPEQFKRIVSGFVVRPGLVQYLVSFMGEETSHYEFEMTHEPDQLKKLDLVKHENY